MFGGGVIDAVEFFKAANARDQVAGLVLGDYALQFGFGPVGAEVFRLGSLALNLGFLLCAFRLELLAFGTPAFFVKPATSQECRYHHSTSQNHAGQVCGQFIQRMDFREQALQQLQSGGNQGAALNYSKSRI